MMRTKFRSGYWVVEWTDNFDPSLADFVSRFPEAVLGHRIAIASCDSGPFSPSEYEISKGWVVHDKLAVSPFVQSISDLPMPGFDEWYVYENEVPNDCHESFVNKFGFSPLGDESVDVNSFWSQVMRFRPLHVLGAGTPAMFFATRDEKLCRRAADEWQQVSSSG
jgi:hypothetical protein